MQRTRSLILLMLLIVGVVLVRESRLGFATLPERLFSDWQARNSRVVQKQVPLVLVEINDSSLSNSRTWPLPPLDFALFLRAGLFFEPNLLAIEPVLNWATNGKGNDLKILHEQMLRCPKLLLGSQLGFPQDPDLLPPLQNVPVLRKVKGELLKLADFPIVERQPMEELRLSASVGFTNLGEDEWPARRVPLVFRYCGQVVPSFVLQSAMHWLQLTPDDIQVDIGRAIHMGDRVRIPIDAAGMMTVDYRTEFTRMGLEDLLLVVSQMESEKKPMVSPDSLKEKVFLLARTDAEVRTLWLPSGEMGAPGELLAAAIATIQSGSFAHRAPLWVDGLIIVGIMGLARRFFRQSALGSIATALMLVPLYLMGAIFVFEAASLWMPAVLPFGLLAFAVLFRVVAAPSQPSAKADL